MPTLINEDTLHDTITITKQSGTTVTFEASGKYIEKDIELTLNVKAGSASVPNTTLTSNPSITMSNTGLVTASNGNTFYLLPNIKAGYVSSGSVGSLSVTGSSTYQIPVATIAETKAYLGIS